jgi:hypothetical protein
MRGTVVEKPRQKIQSTWQAIEDIALSPIGEKLQAMLALGAAFLTLVLLVQGAHRFRPSIVDEAIFERGIQLVLLGVAAMGIALFFAVRQRPPMPRAERVRLHPTRPNWFLAALGLLMIGAVIESSVHLYQIERLADISHHEQFYLLCGGGVLLAWGLGGGGLPHRLPRIAWGQLLPVVAITLLGLGLRFWKLDVAFQRFIDEMNFATVVYYFWGDEHINIFEPIVRGFPAIYPFLQNETVEIWGRNLYGLRAPSAIFGTLTIPAIYLLGRTLFDHPTGLLGAFLLAVYPVHIQWSRLGMNNIADPFFGTLALAFLARGMRFNNRRDYAIAGVCLGMTQYFYEGGRLVFPGLVAGWIGFGLLVGYSRRRIHGLLITIAAALVIAAPIYFTLEEMDLPLTSRMDTVSQHDILLEEFQRTGDWRVYEPKMKEAARLYVNIPEYTVFYYGGYTGLMLVFMLPAFLLGLSFVIWRFYTPAVVLLGWVVLTTAGNVYMADKPITARYVVLLPALALLMAVGIRQLLPMLLPPRTSPRFQYAWMLLVAGMLGLLQLHYYFGEHLDIFNQQIRQHRTADGEDALFRSQEFPPGTHIYMIGEPTVLDEGYGKGMLSFLADELTLRVLKPEDVDEEWVSTLPVGIDYAFYIMPDDRETWQLLSSHFYLEGPSYSPYGVPEDKELVLYYADSEEQIYLPG